MVAVLVGYGPRHLPGVARRRRHGQRHRHLLDVKVGLGSRAAQCFGAIAPLDWSLDGAETRANLLRLCLGVGGMAGASRGGRKNNERDETTHYQGRRGYKQEYIA